MLVNSLAWGELECGAPMLVNSLAWWGRGLECGAPTLVNSLAWGGGVRVWGSCVGEQPSPGHSNSFGSETKKVPSEAGKHPVLSVPLPSLDGGVPDLREVLSEQAAVREPVETVLRLSLLPGLS